MQNQKRNRNFKDHKIFVHDGKRNLKCDRCGKTYTQISGLKRHIKCVHEGFTYLIYVVYRNKEMYHVVKED